MKDSPLAVALTRGFWIAVLSVVAVGLTAWGKTHDGLVTAEICVAAASSVLTGRGLAEGSIDTLRAARAAGGDTSAIQPSDVGAYSPSISPPTITATGPPPPPLITGTSIGPVNDTPISFANIQGTKAASDPHSSVDQQPHQ